MKLAIIGTGKIVQEALFAMEPVCGTGKGQIGKTAIFARPHSADKAKALAQQYGISEVYTDYEELLTKSSADTVYIGLVNSAHYEYAKEALLHDKNVILEKPFVLSSAQATELRDIAKAHHKIIVEAITVIHNQVFARMRENLSRLGPVKLVLCNYSQYSSRYDDYLQGKVAPAFDPALSGGAVYDLDVYNIHYCAGLFGMPKSLSYFPNRGFNGVDTSGVLVLQYDGFTCVCTAAKDSDSPCFVSVQGEKGWMRIDGKPNAADNLTIVWVEEGKVESDVGKNHGQSVRITQECSREFSSGADAGAGSNKDGNTAKTGNKMDSAKAGSAGESGRQQAPEKDASGAIVRQTARQEYIAPKVHHRMTPEFEDFARIIDNEDFVQADELLDETITVVRILEEAGAQARI